MKNILKNSGIFYLSSWCNLNESKIHFEGICYHKNNIIIGKEAFLDYIKLNSFDTINEGRFTTAFPKNNSDWIITNDESGQGLLFYYSNNSEWAVSNSFLFLVESLHTRGIQLNFNLKTIIGFHAQHSTTEQLISHSTLVKEVYLLPYNKFIEIKNKKFNISIKSEVRINNYEEDLIYFKNIWSSRISALYKEFGNNIHCDLTGGYDSRTVFGLLLNSEIDLKEINIRSNRNQIEDYQVATKISAHYDFKLNTSFFKHTTTCSNETAFELWKYGNLGIYFPVYLAINDYTQTTNFHLHGAGGEGLRNTIQNTTSTQLAGRLSSRIKDKFSIELINEFQNEFLKGAKEAGFNKNTTINYNYYSFYRSRYHFGRNQYRNLYSSLITPLNSLTLQKLKNSLPKDSYDTQIYSDLMILCDTNLPYFDFDDINRNFSIEQLEISKKLIKNNIHELYPIKIYCKLNRSDKKDKVENKFTTHEILCMKLNALTQTLVETDTITLIELSKLTNDILNKVNLTQNLKKASYLLSIAIVKTYCIN